MKVVTCVSVATVLTLMIASRVHAQGGGSPPRVDVAGAYSANADYVANRPALLVSDEKVSPFFGLGSGPRGFEVSFTRYVRSGFGIKADLAGYADTFPSGSGNATYCQPDTSSTGLVCGTGLTGQAKSRAFYLTAGPAWKIRRDKRVALFAHALAGIAFVRSTFEMSGSNVQYSNPFAGGVLLFTSGGFPQNATIRYADHDAAAGLALALGGGLDVGLSERLSVRGTMDWAPTFLARPVLPDLTPDAQGRVLLPPPVPYERSRQDHVRLSLGLVWHIR